MSDNRAMHTREPTPLLGGLSPAQFMRQHWQKKPLLVRQAMAGVRPPVSRAQLLQLAASDHFESRVVQRKGAHWSLRHGPIPRRSLPTLTTPNWTLLVQGVDQHVDAAHELLCQFRFVPDARLDDLMVSWASPGGGVGPHLDSYDVFLLQVHGKRRWRIGRAQDESFIDGLPLRILRRFEPEAEYVLEPGDMLYLPPRWAHDGVAEGECMTCSIGFRAPDAGAMASDLLARLGDGAGERSARHYRDAAQKATANPAEIPVHLQHFARQAVVRATARPRDVERALGEALSEPKPLVWFTPAPELELTAAVRLHGATRMLYDMHHVFINGESFLASGGDLLLLRRLADSRELDQLGLKRLTPSARALLLQWLRHGWLLPHA
jgi:50S ribosomal protein L16 3-hydroxylase